MEPRGWIDGIAGVLLDVDGTLLDGIRAIPGAGAAIDRLRRAEIPFRLVTNTTRKPRTAIARTLHEVGIDVGPEEILVPASLAGRLIRDSGRLNVMPLVREACLEDLAGLQVGEGNPDWVVVGDLGAGFTFEGLNRAFHALRDGARLLALHRGRSWKNESGEVVLDAGPFVVALEYAAGVEARLVGKPARDFFDLAAAEIGIEPRRLMMVGDDWTNDIEGGAAAGLRTALVRTGNAARTTSAAGRGPTPRPGGGSREADLVLDSIADLALSEA